MQQTPWNHALNMLARRECSRHEVEAKLQRKFDINPDELDALLDRLIQTGLQSDKRFAESWVRAKFNQGKGPNRIRMELRQKGVSNDLVERSLAEPGFDWFQSAEQLANKKLGTLDSDEPMDAQKKAKLYRFLSYRGFDRDQIDHAIDSCRCG